MDFRAPRHPVGNGGKYRGDSLSEDCLDMNLSKKE